MNSKVSVIVTVYNQELYLKECLESVVSQTLRDLEIIIVDDGSTDSSREIAEEYAKSYQNVTILKQKNKGVSSARNTGLKNARGAYVAFLDGDDFVNLDAYELLYNAAQKEGADTAIGNITCFNENRQWKLSYMSKVLQKNLPFVRHIKTNPELNLTPSVNNKIFKRELIQSNKILFDESLFIGEDLLFTQQCLWLSNKTVLEITPVLNYRVSEDITSLTKQSTVEFFQQLLNMQMKLKKLYVDMNRLEYIMPIEKRQLKFYFDSIFKKGSAIKEEEMENLLVVSLEFLKVIKNEIIYSEISNKEQLLCEFIRNMETENFKQLLELNLKYKNNKEHIVRGDNVYSYLVTYFPEYRKVLQVSNLEMTSRIEVIQLKGSTLKLGGYAFLNQIPTENIQKQLIFKNKDQNKVINLTNSLRTDISYLFANNNINYNDAGFETIEIDLLDLLDRGNWEVFLRVNINNIILEKQVEVILAQYRNSTKPKVIKSVAIIPNYKNNQLTISIEKFTLLKKFKHILRQKYKNLRYDFSFLKGKDYHTFLAILIYKIFAVLLRRKNLWLIGERRDTAQDNSYHLYKYIREKYPEKSAYYVIDKSCDDYKQIEKLGNIINFGSIKHTLYLLTCEKSINSYSETANMYTDAYKKIIKFYPEWQKNDKVFLQHGVIGVSRVNHVLNKNRMGYSLFCVSSKFEQEHIVKEFGYKEQEVPITGLARWDALLDTSKGNEILIMPTWRSWIKTREQLLQSNYFKTFMSLLKSKEFHKVLEDKDLTVTFYPHYQTQKLLGDMPFIHNRINVVKQGEETVQNLLKRHALLITDYSTVSFDFAYMDKPVIFYQFDYDEFYSEHYNEGPINHKVDLFGIRVETQEEINKELMDINIKVDPNTICRYIYKSEWSHREEIMQVLEGEA
ncbi:bifunctional glycosyltransferase/CDP-glycerol:glycerophosphate glycerophosphotransferase [Neobacillus drentensis]|uniref:bifunctional glycosyltransferase/CDP-glycerol:glycerophosphate glycerophosphotransferase n=1 Tax=Neobacillus drentensis TaxID=220684 RepID=UPI002FFE97A5